MGERHSQGCSVAHREPQNLESPGGGARFFGKLVWVLETATGAATPRSTRIPRRLRKALRRELDDNLVFRPKADSGRGSLCARDRRRISSLIHSHQPSRRRQGGLLPVAIDMTEYPTNFMRDPSFFAQPCQAETLPRNVVGEAF